MDEFISGKDRLSELMQKSRLSIMNESFEEELMRKVEIEGRAIKSISTNRKISLLFFGLGVLLGLVINFSLPKMNFSLFGNINVSDVAIYFQIALVLFILVYLEKLFQSGVLKLRRKNF